MTPATTQDHPEGTLDRLFDAEMGHYVDILKRKDGTVTISSNGVLHTFPDMEHFDKYVNKCYNAPRGEDERSYP